MDSGNRIFCLKCKSKNVEIKNKFSYMTMATVYYKCKDCKEEIEIKYSRKILKKSNKKLYMRLWSN